MVRLYCKMEKAVADLGCQVQQLTDQNHLTIVSAAWNIHHENNTDQLNGNSILCHAGRSCILRNNEEALINCQSSVIPAMPAASEILSLSTDVDVSELYDTSYTDDLANLLTISSDGISDMHALVTLISLLIIIIHISRKVVSSRSISRRKWFCCRRPHQSFQSPHQTKKKTKNEEKEDVALNLLQTLLLSHPGTPKPFTRKITL